MAAVLLQTSSVERSLGSGTTQTFTFTSAVPSGSAVIVPFVNYPGGAVTGVTDNQGNTYSLAQTITDSQNRADIWYKLNISSDNATPLVVTANFAAGGNYNTGAATAWSGLSALDKTASNANTATITSPSANASLDSIAFVSTVLNGGFDNGGLGFSSGWNTIWRENNSNSYEGGQAGWKLIPANEVATVTSTNSVGGLLNNVLATFTVTPSESGIGAELTSSSILVPSITTSIRTSSALNSNTLFAANLTTGIQLGSLQTAISTVGSSLSSAIKLVSSTATSAQLFPTIQTQVILSQTVSGNSTLSPSISTSINLLSHGSCVVNLQSLLNSGLLLQSDLTGGVSVGASLGSLSNFSLNLVNSTSFNGSLTTSVLVDSQFLSSAVLFGTLSNSAQSQFACNLVNSSLIGSTLLTQISLASAYSTGISLLPDLQTGVSLYSDYNSISSYSGNLETSIEMGLGISARQSSNSELQTDVLLSGKFEVDSSFVIKIGEYFSSQFVIQSDLLAALGSISTATRGVRLVIRPDKAGEIVALDSLKVFIPITNQIIYVEKEEEYVN